MARDEMTLPAAAPDPRGFRELVERSDHMIARHSPTGRFLYVSPAVERLLGRAPREVLGTDFGDLAHTADRPALTAAMAAALSAAPGADDGGTVRLTLRLRHREGHDVWCHTTLRVLHDEAGAAVREVHTSTRDAADWNEARRLEEREEAARVALAEHAALLRVAKAVAREDSPAAIFALAAEESARLLGADAGRIARFEDGYAVVLGAWGAGAPPVGTRFPLIGERPVVRVYRTGSAARSDDYAALRRKDPDSRGIVPEGYSSGVAVPIRSGNRLWGVIVVSRTTGGVPFPPHAEAHLLDFTELLGLAIAGAEARAELTTRAVTDSLTGLANHRTFFERLEAEAERTRRHATPLSLLLIDIDGFKAINDEHGHPAGDTVLVELARRLTALARAGDVVARMGGEEFGWLLPQTAPESAAAVANRVWRAIREEPFPGIGTVTVSVGVCCFQPGESVRDAYRRCDTALYRAKREGRDRVATAPPPPPPRPSDILGIT